MNTINAYIAEHLMGISLTPPLGYRLAKIGRKYLRTCEGGQIILHDGTRLPMIDGDLIPQPEGTQSFNDRFAWYVAQQLGDKIYHELSAVRFDPPPYTTDLAHAWKIIERVGNGSVSVYRKGRGKIQYHCWLVSGNKRFVAEDRTAPLAICRAAMQLIEVPI